MATGRKKDADTPLDFESAAKQLDVIVNKLENESISLEESLKAFEEGITLIRHAQAALSTAEQRVKLLLDQDDQPVSHVVDRDEETE